MKVTSLTIEALLSVVVNTGLLVSYSFLSFFRGEGWKDGDVNGLNESTTSWSKWTDEYFGPYGVSQRVTPGTARNYLAAAKAWDTAGVTLADACVLTGQPNPYKVLQGWAVQDLANTGLGGFEVGEEEIASYSESEYHALVNVHGTTPWRYMVMCSSFLVPRKGTVAEKREQAEENARKVLDHLILDRKDIGDDKALTAWCKATFRSEIIPEPRGSKGPKESFKKSVSGICEVVAKDILKTSWPDLIKGLVKTMGGVKAFYAVFAKLPGLLLELQQEVLADSPNLVKGKLGIETAIKAIDVQERITLLEHLLQDSFQEIGPTEETEEEETEEEAAYAYAGPLAPNGISDDSVEELIAEGKLI